MAPPASLTLDEAVARAWAQRGVRALAAGRVAESVAAARGERAWGNPAAIVQYTGSTPRRHAEIDQPFDGLFTRGAVSRAGRFDVAAARADSAAMTRELRHDVTDAYFGLVAAGSAAEVTWMQARASDSLSAFAVARLAAGDISLLDREAAALDAAQAARAAAKADDELIGARYTFAHALGDSIVTAPAALTTPLDDGLGDAFESPRTLIPLIPAMAARTPEVLGARADSAAAAARASAAARGGWPVPTLQAGAEWDDPANPTAGRTILAGVSVPLPLWDRGGAARALAAARLQQAAAHLREARLTAVTDGARLAEHLDSTRRRALATRDSAAIWATSMRGRAVRAYRAGQTGMIPVLNALRSERETARAVLEDLQAYQQARAAWDAWARRE